MLNWWIGSMFIRLAKLRGARVIVDVKLASGDWTLAQAAKFFEEQAGFTKEESPHAHGGDVDARAGG